jgi:hypothetical protein
MLMGWLLIEYAYEKYSIFALFCCGASTQTIQFEYDLKVVSDPAKLLAYLKWSGEMDGLNEQVFNLGSIP